MLQCGGKLQSTFSGSAVDVFTKTLRGLAATKLTKPSAFRTADGAGYAVRCSYKVQIATKLHAVFSAALSLPHNACFIADRTEIRRVLSLLGMDTVS